MPMGSSITSSTLNQFGQGPYSYDRFDQREFYNGEFINVLNPGLFDDNPCKAFLDKIVELIISSLFNGFMII